ncbi:MAG TPA: hypothetical protein VJZ16_01435 [Syntrophales bacterium]|nr:hypothetical protein [Syntrophales bacterium]
MRFDYRALSADLSLMQNTCEVYKPKSVCQVQQHMYFQMLEQKEQKAFTEKPIQVG